MLDRGYVTRDAMGVAVRMTGVMQDITERKRVHRFLELRAAECEHRAKNMLMLVQLILRRTQAESVSKYRTAAQERVAALARAHALVSESPREAADLRRLVEEILTPTWSATMEQPRQACSGQPNTPGSKKAR